MIIGESNLIIGLKNTFISDFSISIFFYFIEQKNFVLKEIKSLINNIIPKSNSPPKRLIK